MASKGTIGGRIVLEGEEKYRSALKNIKTEQSELRSEMRLCQTEFKNSQNSLAALQTKYDVLSKQVDTQAKKVKVYEDALTASRKAEEDAAKKIEALKTALADADEEMTAMWNSADGTSESLEEQSKVVAELKNKLSLAEQDYEKLTQKTTGYQTSLNYANSELKDMQGQLDQTEKYLREAEQSADGCATSIDEYGKETEEASEKTNVFGDVLKANLLSEAIISGIKTIASGIKTIAVSAVASGEAFEASMSQVAATMGMTVDEIRNGSKEYKLLSDAAKECGKATMFSASEAAEALNYLALAGYDAEKAAATLPKVLDLAAAGGLDLAYASDLVTDSMAALGLETSQLDSYIDEMARTSQKSNTSVAQLGEATLVCAGTVSLAQQSLETMNTELGILANNGIKGAEGGTHLRNILLALSAPTDVAAVAIHQLGLKVADSNGNMRDLNDIMVDLDASTSRMSSQEKTQIISRIFNKTDIAAVNALLKGTGDEYNSLYAEINNCSGAAAAMAETLNDNLKGKVTILQSALEGLGISAYEIFDDEMKSAVDSATEAVGSLQRSMDNGDLGVSMRKFSKSLGELVEGAAEFGEDALPVVIDGLTWLIDNADLVTAGVTGIVAANLQMKVVGPAVEKVTTAWNLYKTANEGATVSQWLLNTAMNANPAGLLVTAVVGLTAAVVAYTVANKESCYIVDETTGATKKLIETSKDLNESYASATSERKEARDSMEVEAVSCRKLVDELEDLQSKTERTTSEQIRMQMIVDELNQAIPDLNLAIDEQTGLLNMSTNALEKNIDAMMASAKAGAAREDLTNIAEDQYEAEKQLAELEMQLEEQKQAVAEAQEKYNEKLEETNRVYGNQIELYDTMMEKESYALENAKNAQAGLEEQIQSTKESIGGFTQEYQRTLEYLADMEGWSASGQMIASLGVAAEMTGGNFTRLSDVVQTQMSEMQETLSDTISEQINLFSEFSGKAELTTAELLNNMQSQVNGISQWADNMEELAERGIDRGLLQHLANMGPEGAAYVSAFVKMSDEELKKAGDLFEQALTLPDETASKITESYASAGEMATKGYANGISENAKLAAEQSRILGKGSLDELKTTLAIRSPSKETQRIGEYFDEGLKIGIRNGQAALISTISNLAGSMLQTTRTELAQNKFVDIGRQIPAGLAQGISSGKSTAVSSAQDLGRNVTSILQTELPRSRFEEVGGQVSAGLEQGIRNGASGVISAATEMAQKAISAAKKELEINSPSKKFAYLGKMSGAGYIEGWRESMADINAVVAATLPDTSMKPLTGENGNFSYGGQKINHINQEINIYSQTDNLIEAAWKFEEAQKEAAREW